MNTLKLPDDYRKIRSVDLEKDKKLWALMNGSHTLILISGLFIGLLLFPDLITWRTIFDQNFLVLMIAYFLMIVIHELIHGFAIKMTSGFKVDYGFSLSYAFAGNKLAYFDKKSYLIIAMAPVVVIGIFLQFLFMIMSDTYFVFLFMLQILNIAGGFGDFYITHLTLKMPDDMLVNDSGASMTFYTKI